VVAGGDWVVRAIVLLLAAVIAPIVEETMFRGVLYRHLREMTGRLGGALSFFISAVVASFIFAAIHPQGWLGIPPLMGIAIGLSIAREWRGSLIPSMVAHGVNNGLVMAILLVALS
jgi:membrane protease YdiL (CAAX protease family)